MMTCEFDSELRNCVGKRTDGLSSFTAVSVLWRFLDRVQNQEPERQSWPRKCWASSGSKSRRSGPNLLTSRAMMPSASSSKRSRRSSAGRSSTEGTVRMGTCWPRLPPELLEGLALTALIVATVG